MNTSYVLEPISQSLGIDSRLLQYGLYAAAVVVIALILFSWTRSYLLLALVTFGLTLFGTLTGFIPLWVAVLVGVPPMVAILLGIFTLGCSLPTTSEELPSAPPADYGERLKLAYEAKFGYREPEFDKEVDSHIKALGVLRRGPTRKWHQKRLEALENFVEAKR
jgi:hypothetical protein